MFDRVSDFHREAEEVQYSTVIDLLEGRDSKSSYHDTFFFYVRNKYNGLILTTSGDSTFSLTFFSPQYYDCNKNDQRHEKHCS